MKKQFVSWGLFLILLMHFSAFAMVKIEGNTFNNIDPFGFSSCLGADINYVLQDLKIDVDFSKQKNDTDTSYSLNAACLNNDFPKDNARVVFYTNPDENTIKEVIYLFWCPKEKSNNLSASIDKLYEEIETIYGSADVRYYTTELAEEGVVSSKMLIGIGLRNRIRGNYIIDSHSKEMDILLTVRVDPDEALDMGYLSFKTNEWNTYGLDGMGLSVSVPETYDVFTRNISNDDPALDIYGYTASDLENFYIENDIYLNAIKNDGNEEICIKMQNSIFDNFDNFNDNALNMFASLLKSAYEQNGVTVSKYDVFHHQQLKLLRFFFSNPAESSYAVQYQTMHNDKNMTFTLFSYDGAISKKQEKTMLEIVNSIVLDNDTMNNNSIEFSPEFIYTDEATGVTFTVPANWVTESLIEERETYDIKFSSKNELGLSIMYGSTDIWSGLNPMQRIMNPRSSFDNSAITTSDIADALGTDATIFKEVEYNGKTYYMGEVEQKVDTYGINTTLAATYVLRIENGWAYTFYFGGKSDNKFFKDFESIIESIEYQEN